MVLASLMASRTTLVLKIGLDFLRSFSFSTVISCPIFGEYYSIVAHLRFHRSIERANSLMNRMILDAQLPEEKRITYAFPVIAKPEDTLMPPGLTSVSCCGGNRAV